jgi:hypothetical protein
MKGSHFITGLLVFSVAAFGQSAQDQNTQNQSPQNQGSQNQIAQDQSSQDQGVPYQSGSTNLKGVETPSPLTVRHSLSFGMASGLGSSSLQSQSFYSTMLQYQFAAPVTLNLNFSLPIYSSFSPYQNLSAQNIQSTNYFKNIPFDVSLAWKPSDRLLFNFAIINYPGANMGYGMYNANLMPWSSWAGPR